MYADSKSYIVIEIELDRPLVPKRPKEELTKRYCTHKKKPHVLLKINLCMIIKSIKILYHLIVVMDVD